MTITTRRSLDKSKFKQGSSEELILNGKLIIQNGEIRLVDSNLANGRVIFSDVDGRFIWR